MNLMKQIRLALNMPKSDFHHYQRDLQILFSERVMEWLQAHYEFKQNVTVHKSNIKGQPWYGKRFIEIPFAYEKPEEIKKGETESIISEDELINLLPHGSGIDSNWEVTIHKNGNVTAKNSFHSMDDSGGYDGFMPFIVRIFRVKKDRLNKLKGPCTGQWQIVNKKGDIDFNLTCCDTRKVSFSGLKEELTDTVSYDLESILTPLRKGTLTEQEAKQ